MRLRVTAALALLLPALAGAQVTAIRAGGVVDPDAGTIARNQVILVEQGRITAIGANVTIPAGATVIDLSRSMISPGLVDAHTHLCMEVQPRRDAGSYYLTTLRDPDAYRAIEGVVNARTMLEAGFTAVRDIGNEGNYACVQVRRAIQEGMIPGPTMNDADLELAKRNNVVLVGTEYLAIGSAGAGRGQWIDRLARAHKIGVPLVYGTDATDRKAGVTRGQDAITGIDPWIEAGIPAPAILKAMTTDAHRLLGLEGERGFLKVGMFADLIATSDNPLETITTLKAVSFVMRNGVVVRGP